MLCVGFVPRASKRKWPRSRIPRTFQKSWEEGGYEALILELGLPHWSLPRECRPPFPLGSGPCAVPEARLVGGSTPAPTPVARGCGFFLQLLIEPPSGTLAPTLPVTIGLLDSVPAAVLKQRQTLRNRKETQAFPSRSRNYVRDPGRQGHAQGLEKSPWVGVLPAPPQAVGAVVILGD